MTRGDYFALPGVNWSTLKHMGDSPLAYRHAVDNGTQDSDALALGRITHSLVFEPETFTHDYAVWTGGRRAGKEWEAFAERHSHQTILRDEDLVEAHDMAAAVKANPLVAPYLVGGEFERGVQWTDADTGLLCKARPDWLLPKRRILLDLKTAASIDARRFGAAAARYGYHCQLAHYAAGVRAALGWEPAAVKLVVVEKRAPHDVAVFDVGASDLDLGTDEVRMLLRRLRECTDAGIWPGRYEGEQALQLPAYVMGEVEFEYE